MEFLDLFVVASMPVIKVLLVTAVGSILAMDRLDIFGDNTRKQINKILFYVFNPALVGSSLASTITFDSLLSFWFMPLNMLATFLIGSALGWIVVKITKAPHHLRGLIVGCCAAGNLGNLFLIIIPATCKEKGSPFGDPDTCNAYGMAYASLSLAVGAIYLWTYVYNIVRIFSENANKESKTREYASLPMGHKTISDEENGSNVDDLSQLMLPAAGEVANKAHHSDKIRMQLSGFLSKINWNAIFAPSTIGAIIGFIIGTIPWIRNLVIGSNAPLHVLVDSASLLGILDAAVPVVTIIIGGNLLKGLKGSGMQKSLIIGVIAVRYIFLPVIGVLIIKGAIRLGLVHSDPLYQFTLLLQYAVPPAMNIGTITQLFGAGETECSVIMLWTYALASISLTLWSTFFLWLVS